MIPPSSSALCFQGTVVITKPTLVKTAAILCAHLLCYVTAECFVNSMNFPYQAEGCAAGSIFHDYYYRTQHSIGVCVAHSSLEAARPLYFWQLKFPSQPLSYGLKTASFSESANPQLAVHDLSSLVSLLEAQRAADVVS